MNAISKPTIHKAQRKKARLRLALVGPTGSGKTYSALLLAFGIGAKVGLIDTEHGSGDLYADLGDYDVITLEPPYTVQKYRDAIRAFEEAGYDTVIVDSLTHAWSGEGGLLDKQGQLESSGKFKSSFATWREITPEHNKLVDEMLGSPAHIIATMRTKTEYVIEKDDRGKNSVRKIGLSPVQRDGMEYEFTIVMDVSENHMARASKDRTSLLDGWSDRISTETGRMLRNWLEAGADVAPKAAPTPPQSTAEYLDDALPPDPPAPPDPIRELMRRLKACITLADVASVDRVWQKSCEKRQPTPLLADTVRDMIAERAAQLEPQDAPADDDNLGGLMGDE